jgi:hypothetical protein
MAVSDAKPLKNSLFGHSGLDPESRKCLKILDSRFRRNDKRDVAMELFKDLFFPIDFPLLFFCLFSKYIAIIFD